MDAQNNQQPANGQYVDCESGVIAMLNALINVEKNIAIAKMYKT